MQSVVPLFKNMFDQKIDPMNFNSLLFITKNKNKWDLSSGLIKEDLENKVIFKKCNPNVNVDFYIPKKYGGTDVFYIHQKGKCIKNNTLELAKEIYDIYQEDEDFREYMKNKYISYIILHTNKFNRNKRIYLRVQKESKIYTKKPTVQ